MDRDCLVQETDHDDDLENTKWLFSFEFVVESIRGLLVECTAPAVGFRLLDYPTIIIYHTDQEKVESLRYLAKEGACDSLDDRKVLTNDEIRPDLTENDGSFLFRKGKSTLFSMELHKLFKLLSSVPLYIVLMDVYEEKTRFVASCTMSLETAINEIRQQVGQDGLHAASFSKRIMNISLFNLMGSKIGQLKGSFTLYCYGSSLNKHLLADKCSKEGGLNFYLENHDARSASLENGPASDRRQSRKKIHNIVNEIKKHNKSTETEPAIDYNSHLQSNEEKSHQDANKKDAEKRKNIKHPFSSSKFINSAIDQNLENGTCLPPPLFYCSENSEPFNVKVDYMTTQLLSDSDTNVMEGLGSNSKEKDVIQNAQEFHSRMIPWVQTSRHSALQAEVDQRRKNDPFSKKYQTSTEHLPSHTVSDETVELGAILDSLVDMPLLQGLFKEIIKFSKRGNVMKSKFAKEDSLKDQNSFENVVENTKTEKASQVQANIKQKSQGKVANAMVGGKKVKRKPTAKKLKFKGTKSHRLRCAVSSNKYDRTQYSKTLQAVHNEEKLDNIRRKEPDMIGIESQMHLSAKVKDRNSRDQDETIINDNGIDDIVKHSDHASMKSKSPVSLEIYMPSTTESNNGSDSSGDRNESNRIFFNADNVGHSGIYSPKPLDKKWTGLDDLSNMKESVDLVQYDTKNDESGLIPKQNLDGEQELSPGQMPNERPSSRYSENFHSMSNSGSRVSVGSSTQHKSPKRRSSSNNSTESKSSSMLRSQMSSLSRGQESPMPKAERLSGTKSIQSSNSSRSSLHSQSVISTPRRNASDASKPIVSAHSPTTSRSLRTKPRNTYQSNDEITHSVDMSSESLRTNSREEESLPKDEVRNSIGIPQKSEEHYYDHYSDDFVNTNSANSKGSSIL